MNRSAGLAKAASKRAGLACDECRMRKRRCDGGHPVCSGCLKRTTVCIYPTDQGRKARSRGHVRLIRMLRHRLEELESEQPALESDDERLAADVEQFMPSPHSESRAESRNALEDNDRRSSQIQHSPARRPHILRRSPEPRASSSSHEARHGRDTRHEVSTARLMGDQSYGVECLMKPIEQAIDNIDQQMSESAEGPSISRQLSDERHAFSRPCECDQIVRAVNWSLPTRRHADSLVECHFLRFNRMYPILHEQTFMRQYSELWRSGTRSPAPRLNECCGLCTQKSRGKVFPAMVYMIFASGSLFETDELEGNMARGNTYFSMAQQSVDLFDLLDHQVSIEFVQLGLLFGCYLQSTERFSKCWNITGLTMRMAQNMGLHLAPHEARRRGYDVPALTQLESEIHRRVWHGCVMLDREVSLLFGRPLMLPGTSNEGVGLPSSIDDRDLSGRPGARNAQPDDPPSCMEAYVRLIKLYDILEEVLIQRQSQYSRTTSLVSQSKTSAQPAMIPSLLKLDSRIIEWQEALPDFLQCDSASITQDLPESRSPETPYAFNGQAHRLYLRFLHVRILILRPALETLFLRQTSSQKPTALRDSMDVRMQEMMLLDIAAQCVRLAETLVDVYSKLGLGSYGAWWYNISHLHTAGSTLLLGRLCTFPSSSISADSFAASWDLCLERIARYADISTVAKKSHKVLRESAQRLLPVNQECSRGSLANEGLPNQNSTCHTSLATLSRAQANVPARDLRQSQSSLCNPNNNFAPISTGYSVSSDQPVPSMNEPSESFAYGTTPDLRSLNSTYEDAISANALHLLTADDLPESNYVANGDLWSFTPYLSQLEECSPTFGHLGVF